ncbi:unnamed protein product [Amoebophrya sp. A25]|nr:unnamed protein product [Amoebophrya sp. A25]|eukprot:GSA25T00019154001.1
MEESTPADLESILSAAGGFSDVEEDASFLISRMAKIVASDLLVTFAEGGSFGDEGGEDSASSQLVAPQSTSTSGTTADDVLKAVLLDGAADAGAGGMSSAGVVDGDGGLRVVEDHEKKSLPDVPAQPEVPAEEMDYFASSSQSETEQWSRIAAVVVAEVERHVLEADEDDREHSQQEQRLTEDAPFLDLKEAPVDEQEEASPEPVGVAAVGVEEPAALPDDPVFTTSTVVDDEPNKNSSSKATEEPEEPGGVVVSVEPDAPPASRAHVAEGDILGADQPSPVEAASAGSAALAAPPPDDDEDVVRSSSKEAGSSSPSKLRRRVSFSLPPADDPTDSTTEQIIQTPGRSTTHDIKVDTSADPDQKTPTVSSLLGADKIVDRPLDSPDDVESVVASSEEITPRDVVEVQMRPVGGEVVTDGGKEPLKISLAIQRHEQGSRIVGEMSARTLSARDRRVLDEALKLTIDQWSMTEQASSSASATTSGRAVEGTTAGPTVGESSSGTTTASWMQKSRVLTAPESQDPGTSLTLVIGEQGDLKTLRISASAKDTREFVIERAVTPPAAVVPSASSGKTDDGITKEAVADADENGKEADTIGKPGVDDAKEGDGDKADATAETGKKKKPDEDDDIDWAKAEEESAIKLQASARGRRDRQKAQAKRDRRAREAEAKRVRDEAERVAAIRIQAGVRGSRDRAFVEELKYRRRLLANYEASRGTTEERGLAGQEQRGPQQEKRSKKTKKATKKMVLVDLHHVHHHHHFHKTSESEDEGGVQTKKSLEYEATQLTTTSYVENKAESVYQGGYRKFLIDNPPFQSAEEYYTHTSGLTGAQRMGVSPYQFTADQRLHKQRLPDGRIRWTPASSSYSRGTRRSRSKGDMQRPPRTAEFSFDERAKPKAAPGTAPGTAPAGGNLHASSSSSKALYGSPSGADLNRNVNGKNVDHYQSPPPASSSKSVHFFYPSEEDSSSIREITGGHHGSAGTTTKHKTTGSGFLAKKSYKPHHYIHGGSKYHGTSKIGRGEPHLALGSSSGLAKPYKSPYAVSPLGKFATTSSGGGLVKRNRYGSPGRGIQLPPIL